MNKTTPMMEQWFFCKKKAKDALLLFRLGDFYEAFYEDAKIISQEIELTLTKRQNIPMCGVPFHSSEQYIDKLLSKGYKIAIAEQMEDPKKAKGIVKRDIARILTPGTIISSSLLKEKSNNFFVSLDKKNTIYTLAVIDLGTCEFKVLEVENKKKLKDEIYKIKPKEFLVSLKLKEELKIFFEDLSYSYQFIINAKENWNFDLTYCMDTLTSHFKVHSLDGFGLKNPSSITAAGALLNYLKDDLSLFLNHIQDIKKENSSAFLQIDHACFKNLEILDAPHKNTLLNIIDHTKTPMGGRLIKNWITYPLLDIEKIQERQNAIEEFFLQQIDLPLHEVRDLERLMIRIKSGFSSPKDLALLRSSLDSIPKIKHSLSHFSSPLIQKQVRNLIDLYDLKEFLHQSLAENPPFRSSDTGIIKDGFSKDLDEIRKIKKNSKAWIANYQKNLKEQLNIKTLKVGYNKIFGYYIEVSKGQIQKMPETFQRKQTLVNSERFISEELKIFEHKILTAEDRIKALENTLYQEIRKKTSHYFEEIFQIAKAVAILDVLYSLYLTAKKNKYIKPTITNEYSIDIKKARHPIIEKHSSFGNFIPNDVFLDENNKLLLITGPNMAGKSTYIRQIALLVILAQIGSFIPAKEASIGIIDKIFARIGASDDISKGQSTFMVEMAETANILHNSTSRSLVILDEIGRGTSTYDGISIAWAVAEYLLQKKTKTLFATHYFELTKLEENFPEAKNFHISIKETPTDIIFLRKIKKGFTDKSFGIQVAKLAGLPQEVINKAKKILPSFEKEKKEEVLPIFSYIESSPIIEELKNINPENLSPRKALEKLFELQEKALS